MAVGRNKIMGLGLAIALTLAAGLAFKASSPVQVELVTPQLRETVELVIGSGKLRAERQSDAGFEVAGQVEQVLVREGDSVACGATLAILHQAEVQKLVDQVRNAAQAAREDSARAGVMVQDAVTNLARARMLFSQRINSQADLDTARTARATAEASELAAAARLREAEALVQVTEQQAAKRRLLAPFDGLIIKRWIEPGQSLSAAQAALTIAESGRPEIYLETDENNLRKLQVGQRAAIIAPAYRDQPFFARLTGIGPGVDYERGVVGLRFKPETVPAFALMNMTVDVNIEVSRQASALSVPLGSLLETDGSAAVYLADKGRARLQPIKILGKGKEWASVEGLLSNSLVVVHALNVKPGQRLKPVVLHPAGS
jgi:HlyD family secretion protein